LVVKVMVKSGQVGSAWKLYERMERGGFLPNALTFKALVEALGKAGEADKAVEMVKDMGQRGFVDCAGVYYALACTLCTVGRWSEALLQV
jgi:pentatricopeptide repeat protein